VTNIAALPVRVVRSCERLQCTAQGTVTPKTMSCQSREMETLIDIAQLQQLYIEWAQIAAGSMGAIKLRPICSRTRRAIRFASA